MGSKTEYSPMVIGREPPRGGSFFYSWKLFSNKFARVSYEN